MFIQHRLNHRACLNKAVTGTRRWWEARWGPATALSSFAGVGFPTTVIPVSAQRGNSSWKAACVPAGLPVGPGDEPSSTAPGQ